MAFQDVLDLGTDKVVTLGGVDKKTRKPNPKVAEGHYLGSRDIPSKFSKSGFAKLHVLSTPEGSLGVFGKTDLDPKMQQVTPGQRVRITQTHTVPTNKGNDLIKFKVQVDPDDTIDVGNLSVETAPEGDSDTDTEYHTGGQEEDAPEMSDNDDAPVDEPTPARATKPAAPAQAASPTRVSQVQQMLNRGRASRPTSG